MPRVALANRKSHCAHWLDSLRVMSDTRWRMCQIVQASRASHFAGPCITTPRPNHQPTQALENFSRTLWPETPRPQTVVQFMNDKPIVVESNTPLEGRQLSLTEDVYNRTLFRI